MKNIYKILFAFSVGILNIPFAFVSAQVLPNVPYNDAQAAGAFGMQPKFGDILLGILDIALVVAGIIAVLFVILGGFRYVTSAGNEDAAEAGKKTIVNAVIGLSAIILSFVILKVVENALLGDIG